MGGNRMLRIVSAEELELIIRVPYLQPFADVNKRVSRLGANISLIQSNLCSPLFRWCA